VEGLGALHGSADDRPMAQVNAVKVSNSDDRADEPVERWTIVAYDSEWVTGLWIVHDEGERVRRLVSATIRKPMTQPNLVS
jgi:hypothetical protein